MNYQQEMARPLSNREALRRVQAGDYEAFDWLVEHHQERVFNTALRLLGNHDDAADVVQEVFLKCYRRIGSFRWDAQFSTWLYRITVNEVKNHWQRDRRRRTNKTCSFQTPVEEGGLTLEEVLPCGQPGPRRLASGQELHRLLLTQLNSLPDSYRETLVLRYLEELSYREIAQALDCSMSIVKSRIHRGRKMLREKMADFMPGTPERPYPCCAAAPA